MTRRAPVVFLCLLCLPLAACFQRHPAGQQELRGEDCYTCHRADYDATIVPLHRAMPDIYTTTCGNCHRQTSWSPALEGKHSDRFFIAQGAHANIPCQNCHDLESPKASQLGANTNCLICHPDDAPLAASHKDLTFFVGFPYAYQSNTPTFCLECHPQGTAAEHPDSKFARSGSHAVTCSQCHDRFTNIDTSGTNVTCVESRCHHTIAATDDTNGHTGGDYRRSKGTGSDPTFCHECH
jgi:Cytochrome c3